jgi:hypothetical protein
MSSSKRPVKRFRPYRNYRPFYQVWTWWGLPPLSPPLEGEGGEGSVTKNILLRFGESPTGGLGQVGHDGTLVLLAKSHRP